MTRCYVCRKHPATYNYIYGWLPCVSCQKRGKTLSKAGQQPEMVGASIKEQRKQYLKDILPAHRKGVLDKGFVERYGAKKAKEQGFSDKEIKNAKHVWNEGYYKE